MYLAITGIIYFISRMIRNTGMEGGTLINTLMLAGFIIIVILFEKRKIKNLAFKE